MTKYKDGRGFSSAIVCRVILERVQRAGPRGIQRSKLVDELVERFADDRPDLEDPDHHFRRHLTRMVTGRYRDRLLVSASGRFTLAEGFRPLRA